MCVCVCEGVSITMKSLRNIHMEAKESKSKLSEQICKEATIKFSRGFQERRGCMMKWKHKRIKKRSITAIFFVHSANAPFKNTRHLPLSSVDKSTGTFYTEKLSTNLTTSSCIYTCKIPKWQLGKKNLPWLHIHKFHQHNTYPGKTWNHKRYDVKN